MTDREMLGLAAKAAGLQQTGYTNFYTGDYYDENNGSWGVLITNNLLWNPLIDDGDALRLAVALRMECNFFADDIEVICGRVTQESCVFVEGDNGDRLACARRAIVRAAAEIGRAME